MEGRSNLPHSLTSFVGRKSEIRRLRSLVGEERLLTLIGAGGSGKTRLALVVAAAVAERFRDGVFVAELAPLVEARLVQQAVAAALDVPEQPGRPLAATLSDHLRPRHLLLVLDNCEHIVAEVAVLVETLLRACPELHVLATSRVALGIAGERTWSVPPMAPPECVALLVARGAGAHHGFALDPNSERTAIEICRRLDGIPLAIELAAARLRTLTLQEVAERLNDRFGLLTGGSRTILPRHRTLLAAMDWSYELLPASGQTLWRRVAVFAGGFRLEAAEAICSGDGLDQRQVLDELTALVESSLVQVEEESGNRRFKMLETVREYGWLKLREAIETAALQRRHLEWFLALAKRAEPEWRGRDQGRWLDRLSEDIDNVRAALEFSRSVDDLVDNGLQLASGLWLLWHRNHISEGRRWLESLLEGSRPGRTRAYALNVAGFLAYVQGDSGAALPLLEASLKLNEELDDRAGANFSLLRLGIGMYYNNDLDQAAAVLDEALSRYRRVGDRVGIYVSAYELAEALTMKGDYPRAQALHEESLALKRHQGDAWHIALSDFGLGLLAWLEGDHHRAAEMLEECLKLRRDLDEVWGLAMALEALGWVEASHGQPGRAANLLGAAAAMHERMSVALSPNYRVHHDRCVATLRASMTEAAFQAEWARGHGLPWQEAVAFALSRRPLLTVKSKPAGGVTVREQEIAGLVAAGMTNRQIAHNLSVAERTVDAHLEHIMNKLGFRSRAQIAAWVTAQASTPKLTSTTI
jgi:predicted ATPase/DNA-binding CsgD family transcriptional regulator